MSGRTMLTSTITAAVVLITAFSAWTEDLQSRSCLHRAADYPMGYMNEAGFAGGFVSGGYLFAGDDYGLGVWRIEDPPHLTHVSHWEAPEAVKDVAKGPDSTAILATGASGIIILDISRPERPRNISHYDTPGLSTDLSIQGQIAYVADGPEGLLMLDISDPTHPDPLSVWSADGVFAKYVAVDGPTAVVSGADLSVIDVSDPSAPAKLSTIQGSEFGYERIVISGSHAFAITNFQHDVWVEGEISVFDLSDRSQPEAAGGWGRRGRIVDLAISDSTLVFTNNYSSVRDGVFESFMVAVDISDPSNPSGNEMVLLELPYGAGRITPTENRAFALAAGAIHIIDMSYPGAPHIIGASPPRSGRARGVTVSGSIGFISNDFGGLQLVDVSTESSPTLLGRYDTSWGAEQTVVTGRTAYLRESQHVHILDVRDPQNPTEFSVLKPFEGFGAIDGISIAGRNLFAHRGKTLRIFDVTDSKNPVQSSSYTAESGIRKVVASATHAYLLVGNSLVIIDITTPEDPRLQSSTDFNKQLIDFTIRNTTAFIVDGETLTIVDVSDPQSPSILSTTPTSSSSALVEVDDNLVFVLERALYELPVIEVFDVSQASHPHVVEVFGLTRNTSDMDVVDSRIYLAQGRYLEIISTQCRAPKAGFDWAVRYPFVDFTDQSQFGADAWTWIFGDGATSSDQNPTHRYTSEGVYTVTLSVSNSFGADVYSRSISVSDHPETCTPIWVAAAASAPGVGGAQWATDLNITNRSYQTLIHRIQYLPRDSDNTSAPYTDEATLAPNSSVTLVNVWQALSGADGAGALNVCVNRPAAAGVISRTYNTGPDGTFGQSIAGVADSDGHQLIFTGERVRMAFLKHTSEFRTNVGFLNTGIEPITVNTEFFRQNGDSLGLVSTVLAPFSNHQLTQAFELVTDDTIDLGFVDVWSESADARFLTYASMIDNRTGDPVTILPFTPH